MMHSLADYVSSLLRPSSILMVEHDASIQEVVEKVAKKFNCDVVSAGTAAKARELLAKNRFDGILLSVGLPDGSGVDLFSAIREQSETPVCFIVGSLTESLAEEIKEIGIAMFVRRADLSEKCVSSMFRSMRVKPLSEGAILRGG